jgi:hypothetical protein
MSNPTLTVATTETEIVTSGTVILRGKETGTARLVESISDGVVTGWRVEVLCGNGSWITDSDAAWWTHPAFSFNRFADLIHALTVRSRSAGTKVVA